MDKWRSIDIEEESEYSKAMKIIREELRKDTSPGSTYYAWQSNIACSIMDHSDLNSMRANKIAKQFLHKLID
jgi:hypothetical protein